MNLTARVAIFVAGTLGLFAVMTMGTHPEKSAQRDRAAIEAVLTAQ